MIALAAVLLASLVLWVFYLAYQSLRGVWHDLPITTRVLGAVVVLIGFVVDVIFNLIVGTVLFLELPHEATFSQRVSRLKRGALYLEQPWRARLAAWICAALLDPFEAQGHCR